MADSDIITDARFHHTALVAQREYMRNPASIARNRAKCEQLRAAVRFLREERKRSQCTR